MSGIKLSNNARINFIHLYDYYFAIQYKIFLGAWKSFCRWKKNK